MKLGICLPQGRVDELPGWEPLRAWARTVEFARFAEEVGYDSLWMYDHFFWAGSEQPLFEPFVALAALASATSRIRLGHLVISTSFRNPALTAKMICTLDTITNGRIELGLGAGWKEDEWLAYGYGDTFPPLPERLAMLADHLEIITRMMKPGEATFSGKYAHVTEAVNLPKSVQFPRIPLIVGGNGPNVTWRLAAKYADELNLNGLSAAQSRQALTIVGRRCEEIGRDPKSLRISIHTWSDHLGSPGTQRIKRLSEYRELGVSRIMAVAPSPVETDEPLLALARDAREAGIDLP